MVTKGNLRRELFVQSSVLLLSELDASSISLSSSSTLGTLLGFLAQEAEKEQMGGPPPGKLNLSAWSLLVRASPWGVWKGHSFLPLPPCPQIREANEELNFLHSRCPSSI